MCLSQAREHIVQWLSLISMSIVIRFTCFLLIDRFSAFTNSFTSFIQVFSQLALWYGFCPSLKTVGDLYRFNCSLLTLWQMTISLAIILHLLFYIQDTKHMFCYAKLISVPFPISKQRIVERNSFHSIHKTLFFMYFLA